MSTALRPERTLSVVAVAWLRAAALVLLLGVLALAVLTARVVSEGEASLERSDLAFDRGELQASVEQARRAAILYVPGAAHVGAAHARMRAIAIGAENVGRRDLARLAWGAIRQACVETASPWSACGDRLAEATEQLTRLQGSPGPEPRDRGALKLTPGAARESHLSWTLMLVAGLGLMVLGLAVLVLRGFGAGGRVRVRAAVLGGVFIAVGVVGWTFAVLQA